MSAHGRSNTADWRTPGLNSVRLAPSDVASGNTLPLGSKYSGKVSELTPDDVQAILKAHNDARARYGVAPLQWDSGLASISKQWADACYWGHWKSDKTKAALGSEYFAPPRQMGENLSVWSDPFTTALAGQYGTQLWLNEEADFDCQTGQCKPGRMCGHFTQMLWKDTQRVGCALRTCDDGMHSKSWPTAVKGIKGVKYLVCEYSPAGNYTGQRPFPLAGCAQPGLNETGASYQRPAAIVSRDDITDDSVEDDSRDRNEQANYDVTERAIEPSAPFQLPTGQRSANQRRHDAPGMPSYDLGPELSAGGDLPAPRTTPARAIVQPTLNYDLGPELDANEAATPSPAAGSSSAPRGADTNTTTTFETVDNDDVRAANNDTESGPVPTTPAKIVTVTTTTPPPPRSKTTENAESWKDPPLDAPPSSRLAETIAASLIGAVALGILLGTLVYYMHVHAPAKTWRRSPSPVRAASFFDASFDQTTNA